MEDSKEVELRRIIFKGLVIVLLSVTVGFVAGFFFPARQKTTFRTITIVKEDSDCKAAGGNLIIVPVFPYGGTRSLATKILRN